MLLSLAFAGATVGGLPFHATARAATGPAITEVTPAARSNTLYATQPLSATISDPAPVTSAAFTLRDLSAGTSVVVPDATPPSAPTVITVPARFTTGHIYSIAVAVVDAAGNSTTFDQGVDADSGFLALSARVSSTTATISANSGTLLPAASGNAIARFTNVQMAAASTTVVISGTQHAGFGYVHVSVPAESLHVCSTVAGAQICEDAPQAAGGSSLAAPGLDLQFATLATRSSTPMALQAGPLEGIDVGSLEVAVPATWSNAELQATTVTVAPTFPTCASPADPASFPSCAADPLRFFSDDKSSAATQKELNHILLGVYAKDPYASTPQAPAARVAVVPASHDSGIPCGSVTYALSVAANHPVQLSATGGPAEGQTTIVPSTLDGSGTATLTQDIPCGTPSGSYAGAVTASPCSSADCSSSTTPYTVVVAGAPQVSEPALEVVVAPPIAAGAPCGTVSFTVAIATNIAPVTLSNSGGPPGASTTFSPSTLNGTGISTMTQTLPCAPETLVDNTKTGQNEATGGPWAGDVVASGCNGGLLSACNSLTYDGAYVTNVEEGTPITGGLTEGAVLDILYANANPKIPSVVCVSTVWECNHMLPFAATATSVPTIGASPGVQGVPYPEYTTSQYPSLCGIGLCTSPDVSPSGAVTQPPYNCASDGYCPWGKLTIDAETLDEAPCVTDDLGNVSCGNGYYCGASPQPAGTCGGPHTHRWFGSGGVFMSCGASNNGGPNCGDYQWGWADSDGSQDGAALSWGGQWAIDYQSAQADYYWPNGYCNQADGWSLTEGVNAPSVVTSGTYPPTPRWDGQNYVGWQDVNGGSTSSCAGWSQLAGFGTGADMYEGHYGSTCVNSSGQVANCPNNGTINGAYTHSSQQTNWQWSFSCGVPASCSIGVSPSSSTTVQEQQPNPLNYDY